MVILIKHVQKLMPLLTLLGRQLLNGLVEVTWIEFIPVTDFRQCFKILIGYNFVMWVLLCTAYSGGCAKDNNRVYTILFFC